MVNLFSRIAGAFRRGSVDADARFAAGSTGGSSISTEGQAPTAEELWQLITGSYFPTNIVPVARAIDIITETIGSFPLRLQTLDGSGWRTLEPHEHPLARVIEYPSDDTESSDLRSALVADALLWGSGYAWIRRNGRREIQSIDHIPRKSVTRTWSAQGQHWQYQVLVSEGVCGIRQGSYTVPLADMIHLRGPVRDNARWGYDRHAYFRRLFETAALADSFLLGALRTGNRPSGIWSLPEDLSDEQKKQLIDEMQVQPPPGENPQWAVQGPVAFASRGQSYDSTKYLEARQQLREAVGTLFGIPPIFLGDANASSAVGSGLEQQLDLFVLVTLKPYMRRIEKQMMRRLMTPQQRRTMRFVHDQPNIEYASTTDRTNHYAQMLDRAVLNPNEVRREEGLPPREGGDEYIRGMGGGMTNGDDSPERTEDAESEDDGEDSRA